MAVAWRLPPVERLNSMKKLPTISIKGRPYVMVKDKVLAFNEENKNGAIITELLSNDVESVVMKATVYPDVKNLDRKFVGHSEAYRKGQMADVPVEVAETSAIGRALSAYSYGILESYASADEINKVNSLSGVTEIAPHCEICGKTANKVKWGWSCPDWKTHQMNNEKPKMVQDDPVLDENTLSFINSLPK